MLDDSLYLVELCCVDIVGNAHYERVLRRVEPRFVGEQRSRVFRWLSLCGFRVLALVHGEQLARHSRVFGIDPLSLVALRIFYLKAFPQIESVIKRGAEIANLSVVAEPVYVVATCLQEARVKPGLTEIQRRA